LVVRKVSGKGDKTRYLPLHPGTNTLIHEYLESGPLFRPVKNNRTGTLEGALTADGVYDSSGAIQRSWALKSALMHCGRRPRSAKSPPCSEWS
jgi:hypothetical protein